MENRPEMKFRSRAVEAAIFVNEVTDGDGKNLEVRNTILQKRYKDSDGNWQSTNSFKKKDLSYDYIQTKMIYLPTAVAADADSSQVNCTNDSNPSPLTNIATGWGSSATVHSIYLSQFLQK